MATSKQQIRAKRSSQKSSPKLATKQGQTPQQNTVDTIDVMEQGLDLNDFSANNIINLQRTLGNKATQQIITQRTTSPTIQRGLFSWIKGKFKKKSSSKKDSTPEVTVQDETIQDEEVVTEPGAPVVEDGGEISPFDGLGLSQEVIDKLTALPERIVDAIGDLLVAGEILGNAIDVANPKLMPEHQKRFILPRKKFAIQKDGGWTNSTYSYDDDAEHTIDVESELDIYYIGKLADGTVAGVQKDFTTVAGYERLDPDIPLFGEGQPNAEDVKQGEIGDCYLMAALSSLAQQNPAYIKQIMVDQGDKVSVRLYEVDQTDPSNHTFNAKYVTVEKSIAKLNGRSLYNTGALWVSMLEKAYAAGGFTGAGGAPTAVSGTEMNDIAGGFSRHAFEVLMGKEAKSESLAGGPTMQTDGSFGLQEQTGWQGNTYWFNTKTISIPWDTANVQAYDTIKSGPQKDDYTPLTLLNPIFNNDKTKIDKWITYIKTDAIKDMFTKQNTDRSGGYAHEITIQDFEALFNKEGSGVDTAVGNDVLKWIKDTQMFPGELGTGTYSKTQMTSFNNIKDALGNGQSLAISSYTYPSKVSDGTGHSGGEAVAQGMVGGHAYSVLGVKSGTSNDPTSDPGTGTFNWIIVRNPWGKYGREYNFEGTLPEDAGKAVQEGNGQFHLELSDLTKYFKSVDYSG